MTNVDGGGYQPGKMAEALAVSTFGLESMQESRSVVALKTNPKNIAAALKELKDLLLNQPRRPNVVEAGGESKEKLVLLNPALVPSRETIPAQCEQFAKEKGGEYVDHVVTTSYAHYSFDDVLKKLLPAGVEAPASFETIGHIAHLNLRPPHEPYRLLIAQVMIDKYSAIKTVVHKTGNITNEFRVFSMEILADKQTGGSVPRMAEPCDPALEATVKQSGCVFKLNFGDVYWNSRLEGEHARLVSTFKTGDVIWDLMGGIGPFAVPAAKMERCVVHANDLNPRSHHYLVENIRVNKVEKLVTPHCMCARAFLRHMVKTCGSEVPVSSEKGQKVHCVMNLPAAAPEFMDAFKHAFDPSIWPPHQLPLVHLYAFHKSADEEECKKHIMLRAEAALGVAIPDVEAHTVRDVAPKKLMLCCSFRLPASAAYPPGGISSPGPPVAPGEADDKEDEERLAKRPKT